ncbi:unnamed protein product [Protopolystoma xenopodis]|uniref:Uncharacterized protein n=1 Tax=Protopolystoma xenopodis TaxID=117903 RepID=A0A3S5AMU4_9PLAT|nr:unnamed protein product [Protopolystoma xenopodis]
MHPLNRSLKQCLSGTIPRTTRAGSSTLSNNVAEKDAALLSLKDAQDGFGKYHPKATAISDILSSQDLSERKQNFPRLLEVHQEANDEVDLTVESDLPCNLNSSTSFVRKGSGLTASVRLGPSVNSINNIDHVQQESNSGIRPSCAFIPNCSGPSSQISAAQSTVKPSSVAMAMLSTGHAHMTHSDTASSGRDDLQSSGLNGGSLTATNCCCLDAHYLTVLLGLSLLLAGLLMLLAADRHVKPAWLFSRLVYFRSIMF